LPRKTVGVFSPNVVSHAPKLSHFTKLRVPASHLAHCQWQRLSGVKTSWLGWAHKGTQCSSCCSCSSVPGPELQWYDATCQPLHLPTYLPPYGSACIPYSPPRKPPTFSSKSFAVRGWFHSSEEVAHRYSGRCQNWWKGWYFDQGSHKHTIGNRNDCTSRELSFVVLLSQNLST
jgi:hypothetical protein